MYFYGLRPFECLNQYSIGISLLSTALFINYDSESDAIPSNIEQGLALPAMGTTALLNIICDDSDCSPWLDLARNGEQEPVATAVLHAADVTCATDLLEPRYGELSTTMTCMYQ